MGSNHLLQNRFLVLHMKQGYSKLQVLFKMDKNGDGQEINLSELGGNRGLSFVGWTPDMFLEVKAHDMLSIFSSDYILLLS